ncbi:GrpB family protein [Metabacillus halosaccharovorans]|uniref:GrpB family protein n=1 Tax=Metabacillus halosaccharovorans TaxID=930124 RepID=UPI00203BE52F|nr:GrpB family protein [Metabacillus halosaccharovorans]MCM3439255.1 GrpB family protein [Metabacillus halosaccharovorans]
MRKTEIVPWTKNWEESYRKEEKLLNEIFINELVDIFHIGSTSVPAIGYAKPIIDILIIVKNIENVDVYNDKMQTFGYEPRGENGISGRRYFPKGKEKRTHHVHIYQIGNENIEKHLSFKHYLLNHPEEAKKYGDLKIELANKFKDHTHQYQKGKEAFVNELVEKSLRWRNEKNK